MAWLLVPVELVLGILETADPLRFTQNGVKNVKCLVDEVSEDNSQAGLS